MNIEGSIDCFTPDGVFALGRGEDGTADQTGTCRDRGDDSDLHRQHGNASVATRWANLTEGEARRLVELTKTGDRSTRSWWPLVLRAAGIKS